MNKFEELEAVVEVVDRHSFSDAADKLGVSKSILSRRVSDLEKRLGVQLLRRTTRKQSLTDSGCGLSKRQTSQAFTAKTTSAITNFRLIPVCAIISKMKQAAVHIAYKAHRQVQLFRADPFCPRDAKREGLEAFRCFFW